MAHSPQDTDIDPQALENSRKFWQSFMGATKYSVIAIIVVLALMALFLL